MRGIGLADVLLVTQRAQGHDGYSIEVEGSICPGYGVAGSTVQGGIDPRIGWNILSPKAGFRAASKGTTDYVRFPRRPRVAVSFFVAREGQPRADEQPAELAARLLGEIREDLPPVPAGRRHREAAASAG